MMLHPVLHRYLAEQRVREIRRHGRRRLPSENHPDSPITIRRAQPRDAPALAQLAARVAAEIPRAPVLIAESAGRLRAAATIGGGSAIADPQDRGGASTLLVMRAAQLCG